MIPWPINIKDFFLTDEVEKLKRERDNLKEEIESFYKKNQSYTTYKNILNKVTIFETELRYYKKDIIRQINYIEKIVVWVLIINLLLLLT